MRAHFALLRPRSLRDFNMSEVHKKTLSDEATVTLLVLVEGFIALWHIGHAEYANSQLLINVGVESKHADSTNGGPAVRMRPYSAAPDSSADVTVCPRSRRDFALACVSTFSGTLHSCWPGTGVEASALMTMGNAGDELFANGQ